MLRVAQGAPSRRERSNCGADEWTQHEPSLQTTNEQAPVKNSQRPERACARRQKVYGRVSPASGQAQKSQPRVSMRVGTGRGGEPTRSSLGKLKGRRRLRKRDKPEALHAGDERKPCVLASSGNELWVLSQRILPTTGGPAQQVDARRTRARGPP
jgi:hypothetical protein